MSQSGWMRLATRLWTCAPDGNTINLDETDTESLDVETQSEVIFFSTSIYSTWNSGKRMNNQKFIHIKYEIITWTVEITVFSWIKDDTQVSGGCFTGNLEWLSSWVKERPWGLQWHTSKLWRIAPTLWETLWTVALTGQVGACKDEL